MPPKISPPLSPQQLLAQCRWPAAPHQLPARLAPTCSSHPSPASCTLLSLLPPWLTAPYANCGPGVGEGHPCALVPARRAQAPRSYR